MECKRLRLKATRRYCPPSDQKTTEQQKSQQAAPAKQLHTWLTIPSPPPPPPPLHKLHNAWQSGPTHQTGKQNDTTVFFIPANATNATSITTNTAGAKSSAVAVGSYVSATRIPATISGSNADTHYKIITLNITGLLPYTFRGKIKLFSEVAQTENLV